MNRRAGNSQMYTALALMLLSPQAQAASGFATFLMTSATRQTVQALHSSAVLPLMSHMAPERILCHLEGVLTGHVRQFGDGICESLI